jgi:valine--tRNA ligase
VRLGMLLCTSAGNDLIFEETLVEQGRNFCNKVWNAFRLVSGWRVEEGAVQPQARKRALQWFGVKLNSCLMEVERAFDSCRISDALLLLYRLFWDDFSGWLLELLKPARGAAIDAHSKKELLGYFDTLLTVLHPFMPFLTEELWHAMGSGREGMALTVQPMPKVDQVDAHLLAEYEAFQGVATGIRSVRQSQGVAPGEAISLRYRGECPLSSSAFELLAVAAGVGDVEEVKEAPEGSVSFIVGRMECFVALKGKVDAGEVKRKLEEELRYAEGFLASVERKLANEKFVGSAPEAVVALERKKREDALAKIAALRSQLESL